MAAALVCVIAALVGCTQNQGEPKSQGARILKDPPPSYAQIASRQNKRVAPIQSYWSRAVVTLTWLDEDGKKRSEHGEGHLILDLPDHAALKVDKVGETFLWVGCDEERFWFFEGGDNSKVYVGRNVNAFSPLCDQMPLGVHPRELVDLLGIFPFPLWAGADPARPEPDYPVLVDHERGMWVVIIPGRWSNRRVYLDPETWRPMRVELVARVAGSPDPGPVLVAANLTDYETMEIYELGPGFLPRVPTKLFISHAGGEGEIRISTGEPSDRPMAGRRPINPRVFDYDTIKRRMQPAEQIVLDARCEQPAVTP